MIICNSSLITLCLLYVFLVNKVSALSAHNADCFSPAVRPALLADLILLSAQFPLFHFGFLLCFSCGRSLGGAELHWELYLPSTSIGQMDRQALLYHVEFRSDNVQSFLYSLSSPALQLRCGIVKFGQARPAQWPVLPGCDTFGLNDFILLSILGLVSLCSSQSQCCIRSSSTTLRLQMKP